MVTLYQGETITFALSGEELKGYEVRAALRPSGISFRRDCTCGDAVLMWENIDIVEESAVWSLTSEQSSNLPVGKYAMEIALKDVLSGESIKESTMGIIEVKQSYTR